MPVTINGNGLIGGLADIKVPDGTASAPTISNIDDLNTGIFFPAEDTIAFSEGGIEVIRIDSSGRLLIGNDTAQTVGGVNNQALQIFGAGPARATIIRGAADAVGSGIFLAKSRNTTAGSFTILQSGDQIGQIRFNADNGLTLTSEAARIDAAVDAAPSSTSMPGRLVFYTTSASAVAPTERMRIDSAGNVGIGTSSPAKKLHIEGDTVLSASTGAKLHLYRISDTNTAFISSAAGGEITFATGTSSPTERMRIDSAGNVGIGTNSPSVRFHIASNSQTQQIIDAISADAIMTFRRAGGTLASPSAVSNGNVISRMYFQGYDGSTYQQAAAIGADVDGTPGTNDMPGRLVFFTTADGASSPTERMRIDSAGNVGIGTSSPGVNLHVAAAAGTENRTMLILSNADTGAYADARIQLNANNQAQVAFFGQRFNNTTTGLMGIQIADSGVLTERMRISGAGLITGSGTSLGAWTSYTPTLGGITLGNGVLIGKYVQIGKVVIGRIAFYAGSTTSFSGNITFSLPVTPSANDLFIGGGYSYDSSAGTGQIIVGYLSGLNLFAPRRYDTVAGYSATVPWTWAQSDEIKIQFTYEAA